MRKTSSLLALLAVALFATGCQFESRTSPLLPTAPTALEPSSAVVVASAQPSTSPSYVGAWASSPIPGLPSPSACQNFQWAITNQTPTSIAGTFSAVCGIVTVAGSASGELEGTIINMKADGSAVALSVLKCPFALTGIGHIETNDSIRVDYTGTTCIGPVQGTETLRRHSSAPPAPAPPPPPAPEPPPPPMPDPPPPPPVSDDPLFGCGWIRDPEKLVDCIHGFINPHDQYAAFEVTKRVAWALRGDGAGLLIKNGGENIVSWQGYSFAAGRICAPDGHIYKIISDVGPGGANGPSWQDNGFVDPSLYVRAIDPRR